VRRSERLIAAGGLAQACDSLRENLLRQILGSLVVPSAPPHISIDVLVMTAKRTLGDVTHNRLLEQSLRR
jgi:hypothetical protein